MELPDFANLSDFASASAGGAVLFASDNFFAPSDNLIADSDPVFIADKYTEFGKWMDGWETRRKRIPGHDWCIIKLAINCVIRGLLVDTAYFTGNNAPKYSIQAAVLTPEEEELIPNTNVAIGTASSDRDLEQVSRLHSEKWREIVPVTALRPGYEDTRMNFLRVLSDETWTHIRLNIYPDGGIARLRVYGEARPGIPPPDQLVDLLSLLNGGVCEGYSNAHYGHPRNLIKPLKGTSMADGWETARRSDRPEVIQANPDGTLQFTGEEWAVFKLGFPGNIHRLSVDTAHFKGNYPYTFKIEGLFLGKDDWSPAVNYDWQSILVPSKLSADNDHWFECNSELITHIRVTIVPDGGISRIRALGYVNAGI